MICWKRVFWMIAKERHYTYLIVKYIQWTEKSEMKKERDEFILT